jgi:nucleotide-binding universal stress UspA family protein
MFRHILLPTDGSALATRGARAGIKLAKALGARVTAVYVIAPYVPPMYGEAAMYVPGVTINDYKKAAQKQAAKALATVERMARASGVRCTTRSLIDTPPWQGILRAARSQNCDAIAMATHGRSGLGGLILGSETTRVLGHAKVPVIVTR